MAPQHLEDSRVAGVSRRSLYRAGQGLTKHTVWTSHPACTPQKWNYSFWRIPGNYNDYSTGGITNHKWLRWPNCRCRRTLFHPCSWPSPRVCTKIEGPYSGGLWRSLGCNANVLVCLSISSRLVSHLLTWTVKNLGLQSVRLLNFAKTNHVRTYLTSSFY